MSSAFDNKIKSPVLSPSLNEYSEAQITDESSNVLDIVAAVQTDVSGHSNLGSAVVSPGHASQVTGRQQGAIVTCPGGEKVRLVSLVSLDANGNPVPFALKAKFQSAVLTGTGASQNVAHGLGVVPSLVLVAPYDNTAAGSTPFAFQIAEGAHDATNLKITATSGLKYKVIALA